MPGKQYRNTKNGLLAIAMVLVAMNIVSAAETVADTPSSARAEGTKDTSILFIGNSFTYVNDLPAILTQLAKAGGQKPLVHANETPGGCSLEKHWKDGKALKAIQSRKWDFVVLQEVSLGPVERKEQMFEYARKLDDAITKQGAKTLLYMTWSWPKPDAQATITSAYQDLGKELKAQVVPVGIAWSNALREHPEVGLFAKDNHHPSPAGSYLAACVFYATLYERSPEGLPSNMKDLKESDARVLQKLAFAAVQGGRGKTPATTESRE